MRRAKISIIGGGNVGASCALWAASKELGDIIVLDIPQAADAVKGKMLDLAQCSPVERFDAEITGTTDYADTTESDVVIVTAGIPRKPGMSRDDLIQTNVKIVKNVAEQVATHSPDAVMIVVSNPLDAMVYTAWKASGFPTERIVGQAGCLDVARFRTFIAMELGVSVDNTHAFVLGGHGDSMVPLPRYSTVAGVPITELMSEEQINRIVQRTRDGGAEIVNLLGTGSAYFAPAWSVAQMVEAILMDKKEILPCATHLEGEYGVSDAYVGVPVQLGAGGMEKVFEIDLSDDERTAFEDSVAEVKDSIAKLEL